jgi:hypothetical protein
MSVSLSRRRPLWFALFVLSVGTLGSVLHAQQEEGWEAVKTEDGIVVSMREPAGELPTFRGQGTVEGSILHVLAILLDDRRSPEWFKTAQESSRLRTLDPLRSIVYSRSHQTWPAEDREMILKRTVAVQSPGQAYVVRLQCIPYARPVPRRTIRISDCETTFTLRKVDADHTQVEHRVRADPGGSAPLWIARALSKNVPFELLIGLRKQVQRTRGNYGGAIKEWESLK